MAMKLGNNIPRPFRYLYLMQSDGIGTQFIYISRMLDYVTEADCKLIVDFRKMAFFGGGGYPVRKRN